MINHWASGFSCLTPVKLFILKPNTSSHVQNPLHWRVADADKLSQMPLTTEALIVSSSHGGTSGTYGFPAVKNEKRGIKDTASSFATINSFGGLKNCFSTRIRFWIVLARPPFLLKTESLLYGLAVNLPHTGSHPLSTSNIYMKKG